MLHLPDAIRSGCLPSNMTVLSWRRCGVSSCMMVVLLRSEVEWSSERKPRSRVQIRLWKWLLGEVTCVNREGALQPPQFEPSAVPSHSNHLEAKVRAFLANSSGEYPLALAISQSLLKTHQIITAYSEFTVHLFSTAHTKLHAPQPRSNGSAPLLALRDIGVQAHAYPHCSSEHSRQPTRWRQYRMSSHFCSAAPSKKTKAASLTSPYHRSSSTRDPQKMPHGHQAATTSSSPTSVQTMSLHELFRPWQSTTSASAPSTSTPAMT
jgi:hypothetical protein